MPALGNIAKSRFLTDDDKFVVALKFPRPTSQNL
jgi:hypothetical protein